MRRETHPYLPAGLPFGWRGVGLVLAGVLALSVLLDPAWVERQPTICVVHATTGVPCPGCGLTRSFVATGHGDLEAGFGFHAFGPLLFLACGLGLLVLAWWALSRRSPPRRSAPRLLRPAAWAALTLWLVWAAGRALVHVI